MKTKLQVALDDITLENALYLLEKIQEHIDIAEAGTPFLMEYGMEAVRQIRKNFPHIEVLCDGKIMDAGGYETRLACQAGAHYVTVLAAADNGTIADVVKEASQWDCKVVADMIGIKDLPARLAELEELGVDIAAVHTGVDQQARGRTPLDDLKELCSCKRHTAIAVAGGITADTVEQYLAYSPDIIIAGGGIVHAPDPEAAAEKLARRIHA